MPGRHALAMRLAASTSFPPHAAEPNAPGFVLVFAWEIGRRFTVTTIATSAWSHRRAKGSLVARPSFAKRTSTGYC